MVVEVLTDEEIEEKGKEKEVGKRSHIDGSGGV